MSLNYFSFFTGTCLYASDGIVDSFREANITVAQRIEYKESELLPSDIDRYLMMLKRSSRSKTCSIALTHLSCMESPTLIHWNSPFTFKGL